MKTLCSTESTRLYNEARRRVKTLIEQTIRRYEEGIAADSKNNAKNFSDTYNKKHIRSGIGPLKDSAGNLVTVDQNMASMMNDYFGSVFNIPAEAGHITTIDTDTNYEIGSTPITSEQTLHSLEITPEEILKALNDMQTNKSPGPDNIYPRVMIETKAKLLTPSKQFLIYP